MKKIVAMALVFVMACSVTACGSNNEANHAQESQKVEVADAAELLTTVWDAYAGEEFAAMGGDFENPVDGAPGVFDHTNLENLDAMLAVPADGAALIDDAASLMHMMNANSFTAGAFHVANGEDVQAFADLMKESIMNRQWMCGFPETMLIVSIGGEYVVSAFGLTDVMTNFKTALTETYGAEVLYEESLA